MSEAHWPNDHTYKITDQNWMKNVGGETFKYNLSHYKYKLLLHFDPKFGGI